jgi:hypothetical protein
MSKYPDNVAWDDEEEKWIAHILPYASNVGAPVIKPDNIDSWRERGVSKVNHHLESKFLELKDQYLSLVEEFRWNDIIYNAKFSFEPVVGEVYYLYESNDGHFLSLISPNEWDKECIGSFRLNADQRWTKQ